MNADIFTKQARSRIMSGIRSKNTKPEILVRSVLHRNGLRFRLHQKDIPGCPDIVLTKYQALVFVHGCFWHQHNGCQKARMPQSNQGYWQPKLLGNVDRFRRNKSSLQKIGWRVFVIWECEVENLDNILRLVKNIRGN